MDKVTVSSVSGDVMTVISQIFSIWLLKNVVHQFSKINMLVLWLQLVYADPKWPKNLSIKVSYRLNPSATWKSLHGFVKNKASVFFKMKVTKTARDLKLVTVFISLSLNLLHTTSTKKRHDKNTDVSVRIREFYKWGGLKNDLLWRTWVGFTLSYL